MTKLDNRGARRPMLVLASTSPRRREILTSLRFRFEVASPCVEELTQGAHAVDIARQNARLKALDVRSRDSAPSGTDPVRKAFLGVDTIVVRDDSVLSKPTDIVDARRMLEGLQGRSHEVLSGLCLLDSDGREASRVERTEVVFAPMSPAEVEWYLASGEYSDKAGGYGIQGLASVFVKRISGCYFNVVGLPVRALYESLSEIGMPFEELLATAGGRDR